MLVVVPSSSSSLVLVVEPSLLVLVLLVFFDVEAVSESLVVVVLPSDSDVVVSLVDLLMRLSRLLDVRLLRMDDFDARNDPLSLAFSLAFFFLRSFFFLRDLREPDPSPSASSPPSP